MIGIRSLLFNLLFYGSTALIAVLCAPAAFLGRGPSMAVRRFWVRLELWLARIVAGIRAEVRGAEHLPDGAAIVAAKHQSAWETLFLDALLGEPAIVLKKELSDIPVLGAFIRAAGTVPIDRSAGAASLKRMVKGARPAVAEGRRILIFPQGTRVAPGQHRKYLPGAYALYAALDLPVVPVALNSGLYWPRNAFLKRPGTVVVQLLPAIPPGLGRKEFLARLKAAIEQASSALEAEGRGAGT